MSGKGAFVFWVGLLLILINFWISGNSTIIWDVLTVPGSGNAGGTGNTSGLPGRTGSPGRTGIEGYATGGISGVKALIPGDGGIGSEVMPFG
jgi:hypothetical protein